MKQAAQHFMPAKIFKEKWEMKKTVVISLTNQKGGIAKTTTSTALAMGLNKKGYKSLLIDCDPQCNSTSYYSAKVDEVATLYDVLLSRVPAKEAIQKTAFGDIIPADGLLSGIEISLNGIGAEHTLSEALEPLDGVYDYIICDCQAEYNILTQNAICASDWVIVPISPDRFPLEGLMTLKKLVARIAKYSNPKLKILGILCCAYVENQTISREFKDEASTISESIGAPIFKTYIRRAAAIGKAQKHGQNYYTVRDNKAAEDYLTFTDEVIELTKRA